MLIVRLMHIADMPSIPEILKQNKTEPVEKKTEPEPVVEEQPKYKTIESGKELVEELQKSRELLLYSYVSSNLEIIEFGNNTIKYFDRQCDKTFPQKLTLWLKDNTGQVWTLEQVAEDPHQQTISEHKKSEIAADPMVASAMDLFEDAEIVNVSK